MLLTFIFFILFTKFLKKQENFTEFLDAESEEMDIEDEMKYAIDLVVAKIVLILPIKVHSAMLKNTADKTKSNKSFTAQSRTITPRIKNNINHFI